MAEIADILNEFLTKIGDEIREGLPTVTGNTRSSIQVNVEQQGEGIFGRIKGELTANAYIATFETGRPPTKKTGDGSLRTAILKWIEDKGLSFTKKLKSGKVKVMTPEAMSWAIAIKIHKEGNKLFRELKGSNNAFISSKISDARIDQFFEILTQKKGREILADVVKYATRGETLTNKFGFES